MDFASGPQQRDNGQGAASPSKHSPQGRTSIRVQRFPLAWSVMV